MNESFQTFSVIVIAIFVEAMPFLVLGAFLSALLEVLVPSDRLLRYIPRSNLGGIAMGVAAGMVLPTCECGVVPIVRRLMKKGVPGHVAITYMLSAPIINPVVIASTWFAFPGRPEMVAGRIIMAAMVAAAMGLIARHIGTLLNERENDGDHGCDGHGHVHVHSWIRPTAKLAAILRHGSYEFLDMSKFLILGGLLRPVRSRHSSPSTSCRYSWRAVSCRSSG